MHRAPSHFGVGPRRFFCASCPSGGMRHFKHLRGLVLLTAIQYCVVARASAREIFIFIRRTSYHHIREYLGTARERGYRREWEGCSDHHNSCLLERRHIHLVLSAPAPSVFPSDARAGDTVDHLDL